MHVKNTLNKLVVVALAALFPAALSAQTSSINAFSPYTMYGLGELNTPGTLPMRSMGGAGVAVRGTGGVNLLNPASFSSVPQKSFLFNFGLEGQNYYNYQQIAGQNKSTAYNTFNFHDIAFQLPLSKHLGLGFGLTPYSSVGYRMKYDHPYAADDPVWGNAGRVQYNYQGEGDVTEVKVGIGWEIFKNFSVGIAAQYYWGDIDRDYASVTTAIVPGSGDSFSSIMGNDNYSISSIKGQIGVQWNAISDRKRALTLGAAFDFGGDLNPRVTSTTSIGNLTGTSVRSDVANLPLVLPHQLSLGAYYQTAKWSVGVDYVFQNWGGRNSAKVRTGVTPDSDGAQRFYEVGYTNTNTVKMGFEWVPSRYDVRHFFKRWSYRAGFRYGTYNQTFDGRTIAQYAVTAGFGIPVKFLSISAVDIGFEYGRRGYNVAERIGLVRQQYFKFAVGFTLFAGSENGEYWFLRPKYD